MMRLHIRIDKSRNNTPDGFCSVVILPDGFAATASRRRGLSKKSEGVSDHTRGGGGLGALYGAVLLLVDKDEARATQSRFCLNRARRSADISF
jgi:hypothetical protein